MITLQQILPLIFNKIICMAFVSISERKITEIGQKQFYPSPAHYTLDTSTNSRECAPFCSSSIRKIQFDQKNAQKIPGPGQYNLSKPIITPKVTSYICKQNVLLKFNSNGSYQFQSRARRFNHSIEATPSPTQYQKIQGQVRGKKSNKKLPKQKIACQMVAPPSIPSKSRGLLSILQKQRLRQEQLQPGPGYYNQKKQNHINSKGTVWAKDKIERFTIDEPSIVGPGKYLDKIPNTKPSPRETSIFKSNTVRSFFDTLMYGSQIQQVAKYREWSQFKSSSPAPGQYTKESSQILSKNKPVQFQNFGSKAQRFSNQNISKTDVFYDVQQASPKNNKNPINKPFNSRTQRDDSFLNIKYQLAAPGPGYYIGVLNQKKKRGKNVQQFGSTTDRSTKQINNQQIQRRQQREEKAAFLDKGLKTKFGQLSFQNSVFKSKTLRKCFDNESSIPQLGTYDQGYYDMSKKLQRQNEFLDNLRRINVYKPPFQSGDSRFPHYQQWNILNTPLNPQQIKQNPKKQQGNVLFYHISGNSFGNTKRFEDKRKGSGIPGAGTYQNPEKWNIPSFNIRFNNI